MFKYMIMIIQMCVLSVSAATFKLDANSDLVGSLIQHQISANDTWFKIAYYYDVGYDELRAANQHVKTLSRHVGDTLLIPSMYLLPPKNYREGIVVNLSEKRVYYFPDDHTVMTYPVAVGRDGWKTPSFKGRVIRKDISPTWYVPESILAYYYKKHGVHHPKTVPPGPNNPLGNFVLRLSKTGILIHGTNNDKTVGKRISSGCIRMYNRNIVELFYVVDINTLVRFIHEDEKIGSDGSRVYFEKNMKYRPYDIRSVEMLIKKLSDKGYYLDINYDKLNEVFIKNEGIPIAIGYVDRAHLLGDLSRGLTAFMYEDSEE
ncbi:MAG: L,D-transpeptidase family protein [Pseudomonadota bacterium]|nr:L,D-transpeptidase family protein [Pseudomonadota bacterium]